MEMNRYGVRLAALALSLLVAQSLVAYEPHLSSNAVREAYFLGQGDAARLKEFLDPYVKHLPLPKTGLRVAEIEIQTPFKEVVLHARQQSVGYSAQQAEADYRSHKDVILVRVRLYLTPTYPEVTEVTTPSGAKGVKLVPPDFWRDVSIHVSQQKALVEKRISGTPVYSGGKGVSVLTGAEVEMEYDAAQVASAPLVVEVVPPNGQKITAEFDLAKLR
jgi:hypothetical protein